MTYQPHVGSVLPIKNTPLPIDENTYAYFNFNDNLVSPINNIYPKVYHNNIMYTNDYFDEISCKGKHRGGISINEAAANRLNSADFENGWSAYTLSSTGETSFRTDTKYGKVMRLKKTDGTSARYGRQCSLNGMSGSVYNKSVFIKALSPTGRVAIYTDASKSGGGLITNSVYIHLNTLSLGEWTKLSFNKDGSPDTLAGGGTTYLWIDVANGECEFALPQMELSTYYTKPVNGIRYSPYLYYNIDVPPKTISFWVKSNSNKVPTMASPRPLMLLGGELGSEHNTYLECMLTRSDDGGRFTSPNKIGVVAFVNNTSYHCSIDAIDPLDNQWHFVTIEINKGNKIGLWVDGKYAETSSYGSEINFGNALRVGHRYIPSSQSEIYTGLANCSYDDLCIRTAHYSEDEISAWYQSNREFYNPYDYSVIV